MSDQNENRQIDFFMAMHPPTATAQEKQVMVKNGRVIFYEPEKLKKARMDLTDRLVKHRPKEKLKGALELLVQWCFWNDDPELNGKYRLSRPDTDNLDKLLKDCMTRVGFWKDDSQVCREIIEKFWATIPGIYIRVTEMG